MDDFVDETARYADRFAIETAQHAEQYDSSLINVETIDSSSLRDYVFGEFQYFMCSFVRLASVRDSHIPVPRTPALRTRLTRYVWQQLETIVRSTSSPLRHRMLAEYVRCISNNRQLSDPFLANLYEDIKPALREAKASLDRSVPRDELQKVVRALVRDLVHRWSKDVDVLFTADPSSPQLASVYHRRVEWLNQLTAVTKSHQAKKRYSTVRSPKRRRSKRV